MELRLLNGNEIPMARSMAAEVYDACVFPYTRAPLEAEQFFQYTNETNLWREISGNRLFLWGIFEEGCLCAVSAMQNVGHITMLYVRQPCQRRGYGTLLLNAMRGFASSVLSLGRITINVFPFQTAQFFLKRGFFQIPADSGQNRYLSLECRMAAPYPASNMPRYPAFGMVSNMPPYPVSNMASNMLPNPAFYRNNPGVVYVQYPLQPAKKKKFTGAAYASRKVSTKTVLILVFTVLALLFLIGIGYTVHHIAIDGIIENLAKFCMEV